MSFWDVLASVAGAILTQVKEKEASIHRYEDKFRDLDQETLVKKYKTSSGDAQLAAAMLLKERQKNSR